MRRNALEPGSGSRRAGADLRLPALRADPAERQAGQVRFCVVQQAALAERAFQMPVARHSVTLISQVEAAQRAGLVAVAHSVWQLWYMPVQDDFDG